MRRRDYSGGIRRYHECMSIVDRAATYEDIRALPEHLVGELIDGELFSSPRPAPPHIRASSRLAAWLMRYFDEGDGGPGGWWILNEPELHLGGDVLVPDVAGWRRERMPTFPATPYFEIAPDWVCEVVSPSTTRIDRFLKLPRYARQRIPYAWILEPLAFGLEVYRLEGDRFLLLSTYEGEGGVRAEPFDALELPLSYLWIPRPTPPAPQS
jgi:Uma2 family endonuclease